MAKCFICEKKIKYGCCEACEGKAFHDAHISLLKGYMAHDDPLKEIKRIIYGE